MKHKLLGLVDYTGPSIHTRLSNASIGHFTALVLRFGRWIRYDDMTARMMLIQETYKVQPHLMLYKIYRANITKKYIYSCSYAIIVYVMQGVQKIYWI